jgi:microcystin-dependent protein
MALQKLPKDMLKTPNPGTTKGDLIVTDSPGVDQRLAVGTDGQVLTADSAQTLGMRWVDPAASPWLIGELKASARTSTPALWYSCDGSALSRSTYSSLYDAITIQRTGTTHSNTTVDGLSTTADLRVGMPIEGTGIVAGTVIASIDSAAQITLSVAASASGSPTLRFFPWGNGDGSTTFNLPDIRGRAALHAGQAQINHAIKSVNTGTDQITVPHNLTLLTGQAVVYTSSGTVITGLTSGNTYYVIRVSATVVQLASSRANAVALIAIDLTGSGSGTQQLVQTFSDRRQGQVGGEEDHSMTISEMPAHTHSGGVSSGGSSGGSGTRDLVTSTGSAGGSTAANNMPPYAVVNWIIYGGV